MNSVNDDFPKKEEKPSSVTVLHDQYDKTHSTRTSSTASGILCHASLSQFFSFFQKPVKRASNIESKKNKDYTPFSNIDSSVAINKHRPPALRRFISSILRRNSFSEASSSRRLNQQLSSISALRKYTFSTDSVSPDEILRNAATHKTLSELYLKACEEAENCERSTSSPCIKPDEALRCRYLRLSEKKIAELLQSCRNSGIYVDIHPHMKESDIDINTVMSSENRNTMSL
ncbi:uncharacterized protein C16orf78 homolog isoform X2 [Pyxicephalus adspersus]|uniref:Uncharacterized protein n=1 Tax=Pyxicephalus adspersus TaxID=30357 RepID=A0AAV2ZY58_PYXAD|nr:TPA: hypothetical protein GDO54_002564 [Pyxicephalus adspersus]